VEPNDQPYGRHRYVSSTCGMRGHLVEEAACFKALATALTRENI